MQSDVGGGFARPAADHVPTPRSSGAVVDYHGLLFFAGGECRTGTGAKTFDEVQDLR
jgi:hypothetical protein